jgi:hypothetical protein
LQEASQTGIKIEAQILANRYDEFVMLLFSELALQQNKADSYPLLCYTRAELAALQKSEMLEKNVATFIQKAIALIDIQIKWTQQWMLAEQSTAYCPHNQKNINRTTLQWTGSIVEWVELIYALYLVKRINNGKISLKELFRQTGEVFNFEVKEFANYFMNIKNRTDGHRTKFTDLLRDAVLGRMTDADRKPSRK